MNFKPYTTGARTFALVALVVIILLGLHFLPPVTIGGYELRRVDMLSDVRPVAKKPLAVQPSRPSQQPIPETPVEKAADTPAQPADTAVVPSALYLPHFFSQLANVGHLSRPVRIAYFGDSFIEGDILTGDLREMLQDRFGGSGVGWVDCGSVVNGFRQTVGHQYSGLEMHDAMNRPYNSALAGIAQRYFVATSGATVAMSGTRYRRHLDSWDQSTLFLRTPDSLHVAVTVNGDTTVIDSLGGSDEVQAIVQWGDSVRLRRMSYRLHGHVPPQTLLYGIAHDARRGVVLDNFSLRGSSGVAIAALPQATLNQFARLRQYDLIVLHFGLNMVDDHNEPSVYQSYAHNMGRAIDHLRAAFPEASILVISVPDRDQRTAEGLTTMEGVRLMVAQQQRMAAEHHAAFLNLFEAMGGEGSMSELVERGMANKDYTHINSAGGRHVAKIIFQSLMEAYQQYTGQHDHPSADRQSNPSNDQTILHDGDH